MDLSPGRLALIAEDPRTDEEKECDLERQAQALTSSLFAVEEVTPPETKPERPLFPAGAVIFPKDTIDKKTDELGDENEEPEVTPTPPPKPLTKFAAYTELVQLAEEEAITLKHSIESKQAAVACVSLAQFEAKRAGLTAYEITTALLIGEFRGKAQVKAAASNVVPPLAVAVVPAKHLLTPEVPPSPERNAERTPDDDAIPILWLNRDDLTTRRPDLIHIIQSLNDDELDFIAEKVGDALEEFYWIQVNVVLSLFLDHDLTLHLRVPKNKAS